MSNNKTKEFVIDTQSPYYLHPSEFDGENYELWEKAVQTALTTKNKVVFIDGTISKPKMTTGAYSAEANAWIIVNSIVTSWILNVVDPKLHASIAYADSAEAIWENIQKRYAIPNVPKIHRLKAAIASSKQGNLDVVEFFSKLMGLWNELENIIKCPTCMCEAASKYAKMVEED